MVSPRWITVLCTLLLAHQASADAPAAKTLLEMVQKIDSGEFDNNFNDDGILKGKAKDDLESVAGCLLDKVGAIVIEHDVASFVNDLQVDLAACCTKDRESCLEEVSPAYGMLAQVAAREAEPADVSAHIAAILLQASRKRIKAERVKPPHSKFLGKCTGAVADCPLKQLMSKDDL